MLLIIYNLQIPMRSAVCFQFDLRIMETFNGAVLLLRTRCQHLFRVQENPCAWRLTLSSMAQENA